MKRVAVGQPSSSKLTHSEVFEQSTAVKAANRIVISYGKSWETLKHRPTSTVFKPLKCAKALSTHSTLKLYNSWEVLRLAKVSKRSSLVRKAPCESPLYITV